MKTARDRVDKELVTLQRAVTPDEVWKACSGLLRAMTPVSDTLIGLPSLGIIPFFLRTTMQVPPDYFAEFSKVAPIAEAVAKWPGLPVSRMSDHFTPPPEFREKFLTPFNWAYSMAMLFWDTEGNYIGQLGATRSEALGDFTDEEKRRWRNYHPHVNAAIRRLFVLEKNAAARNFLENSVRALPLPMVAVGWDMNVSYSNRLGREALHLWNHGAAARGLNSSGELSPDLAEACRALRAGWEQGVKDHDLQGTERSRSLVHPSHPGLSVVVEIVEPVAGRVMQPSFALQFDLPDAQRPDAAEAMAALAKLTPAEKDVARLVAEGDDNGEIALRLGVCDSTVRTHLRHIFEKLKINRRAKLASLLRGA